MIILRFLLTGYPFFYGKTRRKRFSKSGKFSGVPLSDIFHTWAPDEPNNLKDNENCIFLTSSGNIGDTDCYSPRPYVCYRKNDEELVLNECGTTDDGGYIYIMVFMGSATLKEQRKPSKITLFSVSPSVCLLWFFFSETRFLELLI